MMSKTPRTDAAAKHVGASGVDWHHSATMMRLHAMTLEDELNWANEKRCDANARISNDTIRIQLLREELAAANARHNDALIHATNAEKHLSGELDAALALVVAKDMALREARKALLERNGLDRDADRKAAIAINMALTTIVPKT